MRSCGALRHRRARGPQPTQLSLGPSRSRRMQIPHFLARARAATRPGSRPRRSACSTMRVSLADGAAGATALRTRGFWERISGCARGRATGARRSRHALALGRRESAISPLPPVAADDEPARWRWRSRKASNRTTCAGSIAARGLPPGPGVARDWPWPLRLHALGRFEIAARRRAAASPRQGAEEAARAPEGARRARRPRGRDAAISTAIAVAGRGRRRGEDVVRQHALSPAQADRPRRRADARRRQALARPAARAGSTCGRSRPRSTRATRTPRSRSTAATSSPSTHRCRGRCPRATGSAQARARGAGARATRSRPARVGARALATTARSRSTTSPRTSTAA